MSMTPENDPDLQFSPDGKTTFNDYEKWKAACLAGNPDKRFPIVFKENLDLAHGGQVVAKIGDSDRWIGKFIKKDRVGFCWYHGEQWGRIKSFWERCKTSDVWAP